MAKSVPIPADLAWDGFDEKGFPVSSGEYKLQLDVTRQGQVYSSQEYVRLERKPAQFKSITAVQTDEGLKVSLTARVLFSAGKANVKPASRAQLNEVIALLNAYPNNQVRVDGHTDSTGGAELNRRL